MDDNHCLEQQPFSGLSEKEIVLVNAGKHVCAFCDEMFRTLKELKKHYEVSHDEIELKQEQAFNTDESFQKWKKEEVRTKSLFVKNGGVRKRAKNNQFSFYICNRCGIAKLKSERKRHEEIGGSSVKCGKTFPAYMTAIREQKEEAIKITVQYQSVHAGYEMQVGKLRLYKEDRRNLASLLKAGVPYTNIIENVQKKCPLLKD
ncbi:c2H2-type domain-containing protein [Trichonephila clavipes]|nr:c2H2-type domain-containing protein [Trichonephila clavipes]